ncbi:MAG TPA: hypothetical protein VFH68_21140 [Polyangia bacterium]|nr:hypothetical protein [Polyangia bacterium]
MAAALAATACLREEPGPDPNPCYPPTVSQPGLPGAGTFEVVVGADDTTRTHLATVWHDGDHVPLVRGAQGGFMIRPALDVTAGSPLPAAADGTSCLGVLMEAQAPANAGRTLVGVKVKPAAGPGATYHVPALFGLLSFSNSIDGVAVPVTLAAQVMDFGDGRASLTVVPDSAVH